MKQARYRAEYLLLRWTVWWARGLRGGVRRAVAHILGTVVFDLLRIRRRVTLANLGLVYGDSLTARELVKQGRRCYRALAMRALEVAQMTSFTRDDVVNACSVRNMEILVDALSRDRGVILASGHIGNWELMAASLSARGIPFAAVAAPLKNPFVDEWITSLRAGFGMRLLPPGKRSARAVLQALRSGCVVLLLMDQDARSQGVFVRFLGRSASTRAGAARLAQRTGAPIVPCTSRPGPGAYHTIVIHPAISPPPRGAGAEEITQKIQEITAVLERSIQEEPSLWFWPHRRFKTRPPE